MKIVLSGVVVAAAGVALIIAAASAVWDLVTVGAAAVVVYYTVKHYRSKVDERDNLIKDSTTLELFCWLEPGSELPGWDILKGGPFGARLACLEWPWPEAYFRAS